MARKSTIRHHLAPSVPLELVLADEFGTRTVAMKLAFDFNSFALVEQKTGVNLLRGNFFDNLSCDKLRVAFWAALQIHQQADYSGDEGLEIAGSYITFENASLVSKAVTQAFVVSLPKPMQDAIAKAQADEAVAAAAGTENPPA